MNTNITITDVRIKLVDIEGKRIKAIASITIDNSFVVNDLKVIDGSKGIFVAMPSSKTKDGTLRDIAHPIKQEARDVISSAVLEKYELARSEAEAAAEATGDGAEEEN